MISISDQISCIEAADDPLSAEIGIIRNGSETWLYDVGNGEKNISGLNGSYRIVLSHFHADHTGNIGRIRAESLYVSNETYAHVHRGTIVSRDIHIGQMHIFPLPSSHTKGCLGLEVDETFAFVGDALYSKVKDDCYVYNAQLLCEEINVLSALRSPWLLVSHFPGMIRKREDVMEELKAIWRLRDKNTPEIKVRKGG